MSCAVSITEVVVSLVVAIHNPPLVGPCDDELISKNHINPSCTFQSVKLIVALTSWVLPSASSRSVTIATKTLVSFISYPSLALCSSCFNASATFAANHVFAK